MASAANGQGVPLEVVDRYADTLQLKFVTDYGNFGIWTDILVRVTNFMHRFLDWLHYVIPTYGVCIILLTLLVRGLMHPISRKQAQTSVKMQEIMPQVKELQEKHKGDRQALAKEQMALYRKHGVHPLGSCWVIFLQMPIFLGLYYALQESIHFRLASFLWVKNLAAPDMLIWWTERIPWISAPENQGSFLYLGPYFNLLPVLAVALMMVQQKYLTPPPTDETQEMQFKMMKYMMVFMGLMFYKVAAGLCIYFIVSSIWGVTERKLLPKPKKAQPGAAPAPTGPGPTRSGGANKPNRNAPRKSDQRNGESNGPFKKLKEMWAGLLKEARKK
jgi:YidC/Oxa1 family membrane protein insertase